MVNAWGSFTLIALGSGLGATAYAGIVPFWRVNPIPPQVQAVSHDINGVQLLTTESRSVSLMMTLTDGSQFNVAGLNFYRSMCSGSPAFPDAIYFNRRSLDNNRPPTEVEIAASPNGIAAFDTYVATADLADPAATPSGMGCVYGGQPRFGDIYVQTAGENRTGLSFNVAWVASPPNGVSGQTYEIARITFASGVVDGFTTLPIEYARMRDNLNPNVDIALPPIPVQIPEPVLLWGVAGSVLLRRR